MQRLSFIVQDKTSIEGVTALERDHFKVCEDRCDGGGGGDGRIGSYRSYTTNSILAPT